MGRAEFSVSPVCLANSMSVRGPCFLKAARTASLLSIVHLLESLLDGAELGFGDFYFLYERFEGVFGVGEQGSLL